jgi:hypothetical protein
MTCFLPDLLGGDDPRGPWHKQRLPITRTPFLVQQETVEAGRIQPERQARSRNRIGNAVVTRS